MSYLSPEKPRPDLQDTPIARAEALNARFADAGAQDVMHHAARALGAVTLVSSFGAESVVLLHMAAQVDRAFPVLFLDTEMLFPETLAYQREVTRALGLTGVTVLRALDAAQRDPAEDLHLTDPDACCALRKTEPLQDALRGHDGWITGRKRFQAGSRAALEFFEPDPGAARLKINPLAHWTPEDVRAYMTRHRLPRHPLVARGFKSIGCAPCTSPVKEGEDPRAGRWRSMEKEECGIHFVDGKLVRTGAST